MMVQAFQIYALITHVLEHTASQALGQISPGMGTCGRAEWWGWGQTAVVFGWASASMFCEHWHSQDCSLVDTSVVTE